MVIVEMEYHFTLYDVVFQITLTMLQNGISCEKRAEQFVTRYLQTPHGLLFCKLYRQERISQDDFIERMNRGMILLMAAELGRA